RRGTGAYALPYALVGGLLVLALYLPLSRFTTFQWLLGSAALLLFSVVGYFGAAHAGRLFVAGGLAGLLGLAGAVVALDATPAGVAAVLVAGLVAAVVGFPLLAMRLGKLPLPVVPQAPADLIGEVPDRTHVFAAVARADEMLTGMLIGAAIVHVVGAVVLVVGGGFAGGLLVALVALSNLLRARLFLTVRQRLPLLLAGT